MDAWNKAITAWVLDHRKEVVRLQPIEWRAVPGWDGYEVSIDGRVRSYRSRWGMLDEPSILRSRPGRYDTVVLSGGKTRYVHHLVLEAFVGPRPEGAVGCHNDGNSRNNCAYNLRWDSLSGNQQDRTDVQRRKTVCDHGHENDRDATGKCRPCRNKWQRERRARKKARDV